MNQRRPRFSDWDLPCGMVSGVPCWKNFFRLSRLKRVFWNAAMSFSCWVVTFVLPA